MENEKLLKLLLSKINSNELRLINETYKRKYVDIEFDSFFEDLKVIEEKCSIKPYKTPDDFCSDLEKDGYVISIVGTYDGIHDVTSTFHTWRNGAHRGYGDTLTMDIWTDAYLNIDNNGNEIILSSRQLISKFKSPRFKYS